MGTMEVAIVLLHLPEGSSNAEHKEFHRRVYGRTTSTWGGKYQYRLQGLLDEIPHVKLYRGAILIRVEHLPMLEKMLQKFSAECIWREIKPWEEDLLALSVSPE